MRILMLLWLSWWFGIALPGHQRGAVSLSEGSGSGWSVAAGSSSCCARLPADANPSDAPAPDRGGASRCALCHLMAVLTVPPPADVDPGRWRPLVDTIPASYTSPTLGGACGIFGSRDPPRPVV